MRITLFFEIPVMRTVERMEHPSMRHPITCERFVTCEPIHNVLILCVSGQACQEVFRTKVTLAMLERSCYVLEDMKRKNKAAQALGRLGGLKGGKARAAKLTPEQRKAIAQKAAAARWATTHENRV
jgi:hypothetical protein